MKSHISAFLLALAVSCSHQPAHAQDALKPETREVLQATTVLLTVDWLQTRDIATRRNPDGSYRFAETNRILGERPSLGDVNRYFLGAIGGTWVATNLLPEPYAGYFVRGVAALQVYYTGSNAHMGVTLRF